MNLPCRVCVCRLDLTKARAEVEQLRAQWLTSESEADGLRQRCSALEIDLAQSEDLHNRSILELKAERARHDEIRRPIVAERDRLRAEVAALEPVLGNIRDAADTDTAWLNVAQAYDHARAELEPTPIDTKPGGPWCQARYAAPSEARCGYIEGHNGKHFVVWAGHARSWTS